MSSFPKTLAEVLNDKGSRPALLPVNGPQIKREDLKSAVYTLASTLQKSGIRAGSVVSIADGNTVEFVVAFLAVTAARGVAAPLNQNYTKDEFKFYMEDAQSKLLIVPAAGNQQAEPAATELQIPIATIKAENKGGLHVRLQSKTQNFQVRSGSGNIEKPNADDVALFLHTSGTTSRPKGVPLSQGNLAASLANIAKTYELTPADRSYLVMPLFHVHGLMAGLLAPLAAGSAVILPEGGKFSAGVFWKDAVNYKATFYTAVPTIHQLLLARADKEYPRHNPPPLRFIRSCSSSLAAATLHKLEKAFGVPVLEAYAMTEASHQMTSNPLPKNGPHKAGTVGIAQGTVQVYIVDASTNKPLPQGKIGEVCLRGPNVTKGYLNNPKANEEGFAGGYFHTGDQGFLDKDGFLTLTGRIKELINRGGEKISPIEVDGVLLSHPKVSEAVAFGAPDEKFGETVAAAIVPSEAISDTESFIADVKKHAGGKLAKFKVPEQIFVTDKLPKTATGKIQRRHMVDAFIKNGKDAGQSKSGGSAQGKPPTQPRSKL